MSKALRLVPRLGILALFVSLPLGCTVALELPEDVQIHCAGEQECPEGFECYDERCIPITNNQAPSVTVGIIERSVGDVAIPVTVFDPDDTQITLEVEVLDGGNYTPVMLDNAT